MTTCGLSIARLAPCAACVRAQVEELYSLDPESLQQLK
jgi:hypothetical protein